MKLKNETAPNSMTLHMLWVAICWIGFTVTGLASAQGNPNETAEVQTILQQAREAAVGVSEDCHLMTGIARAQAKTGDVESAIQTASEIRGDWCSRDAFEQVNLVLGDVQSALGIAAGVRGNRAKTYALLAIVKSQEKAGHLQVAKQAAAGIPDGTEWKATALTTVARAQAKAGDRAGALQTFDQALQAAAHLREDSVRATALEEIATAQAEAGDISGALRTVKQVYKAEKDLNWHYFRRIPSSLVTQLAEAGDMKGAQQIIAEIGDASVTDSAWRAIAKAQAKSGEVPAALRSADNIPGEAERAKALRAIGAAQGHAGDPAGAARTLEQAFQAVATIRFEIPEKASALGVIARAQAGRSVRDYFGAAKTVEQAIRTVDLIRESFEGKETVLTNIAAAQAAAGEIQGAIQTANGIREDKYKHEALKAIARAQAKSGDLQGAYALATSQRSSSVKANALLDVAEGTLERKDAEQPQVVSTKP